ncbi:hypothetical protein RHODGE_RHODGE_02458 [Rhodoplanes serenus]|uniref:DUF2934 domain-containing protein n=1 Tax=Rhodoplanes serenus TaxID=200615 RepID=A0A3S4B1B1_9BRAD|nr:DUF2934 domain-containing protein [Rhodoplanes serenus]VCU09284.1 hypothetical protein RHODGE_RHODGE_02458 [Rhodoplanes serenus]
MSQTLQERIRERAYHIWNGSGRPDGRDEQFWLQAEREILAETATASVSTTSVSTTTVPAAPAEEKAAPTVTIAPAEEPVAKKAPKKAARLVAKAKAAAAKRTGADATPLVEATSIVPLPGQPAVPAAAKPATIPAATLAKAAPKSAAKSATKPRLRAAR